MHRKIYILLSSIKVGHRRYIKMKGELKHGQDSAKRKIIREKGWFIPALHEKYLRDPRHP